ncbi:DUF2232 domain-containing protein [Methylophaga lonarensis]|uniref:DUF2232 domain-containing protein n=1 Tax=Methylophaga lonarensis TaxID=999151 RepID=UPI003D2D9618
MLRSMAGFAMKGLWQSAFVVALLSLGALLLPPLSYLASGVIVLATLRIGPVEGAKVLAAALLVAIIAASLILEQYSLALIMFVTSWLPVYGITLVLGYSRSMTLSLLASAGLGIAVVLAIHLFIAEPAAWWFGMLTPLMELLQGTDGWQLDQAQTQALFSEIAKLMTGLMAAAVMLNVVIGLLIGRAWQASLYDPGAFGNEFCQIRLGKPAALLTTALLLLTLLSLPAGLQFIVDCLPVMLVVFALQGIAIAHALVRQRNKSKFWLIAMYVMLVFMLPQMVLLLAMLGVIEQWVNFRKHSSENNAE